MKKKNLKTLAACLCLSCTLLTGTLPTQAAARTSVSQTAKSSSTVTNKKTHSGKGQASVPLLVPGRPSRAATTITMPAARKSKAKSKSDPAITFLTKMEFSVTAGKKSKIITTFSVSAQEPPAHTC